MTTAEAPATPPEVEAYLQNYQSAALSDKDWSRVRSDVIRAVRNAQPTNCTQVRLWSGALCELLASHVADQLSVDDVLTPALISRHVTQLKTTQKLSTVQNKHGRLTRLLRGKQGLLRPGTSDPESLPATAVGLDDINRLVAAIAAFPKAEAELITYRLASGLLFGVTGAKADASVFNWEPGMARLELNGGTRSTTSGWLQTLETAGLLPLAGQGRGEDWGEAKNRLAESKVDISGPRLRAAWLLEQIKEAQPAAQLLPNIGIRSAAAINRVIPLLDKVDLAQCSAELRGN
jgi:hypothetical protein